MNARQAPPKYALRLYIADQRDEAEKLKDSLQRALEGEINAEDIEIIDVVNNVARALADHIFATPTLVKTMPAPEKRVLGDFSDIGVVLRRLEITPP